MSFAAVTKLLDPNSLSKAATLLPWSTSIGGISIKNPLRAPVGLQKWLQRREENRLNDQNVSNDFFSNNGILLAVPKKKVSHQKKRQKLYGPGSKQLKMMHNLNKCPACGHFKLANALCMHCVEEVSHIWKSQTVKELKEPIHEQELSELDRRVLYPGKKDTAYVEKLKDRDSYLERRMRSLPVDKKE